jgi:hypothetical protein
MRGLVWFLRGETIRALWPEHAVTDSARVFDRGALTKVCAWDEADTGTEIRISNGAAERD